MSSVPDLAGRCETVRKEEREFYRAPVPQQCYEWYQMVSRMGLMRKFLADDFNPSVVINQPPHA